MTSKPHLFYKPYAILNQSDTGYAFIGDIHGELDSLIRLLDKLGVTVKFTEQSVESVTKLSTSPHLVFLGDFVDRGPDSVTCTRIVQKLIELGLAQSIVGNHELNIINFEKKDGNGWFFNYTNKNEDNYKNSRQATDTEKVDVYDFINQLPFVLLDDIENPSIVVTHACYNKSALAQIIKACEKSTLFGIHDVYKYFKQEVIDSFTPDFIGKYNRQMELWWGAIHDKDTKPNYSDCEYIAWHEQGYQKNPVRILTSGPEDLVSEEEMSFVGGRWRFATRSNWWNDPLKNVYTNTKIVVGHYWRKPGVFDEHNKLKTDAFTTPDARFGAKNHLEWFGLHNNVFCVDYSVGRKFDNRNKARPLGLDCKLAALILTGDALEVQTILFDEPEIEPILLKE